MKPFAGVTVTTCGVAGLRESLKSRRAALRRPELGGAFKAFEKIVNRILFSPIRENKKCPKALPREGCCADLRPWDSGLGYHVTVTMWI